MGSAQSEVAWAASSLPITRKATSVHSADTWRCTRGRQVRAAIGAMPLTETKRVLDELIRASRTGGGERAWWDVMRDENEGS